MMNRIWTKYSTETGETWLRLRKSGVENNDDEQLVKEGLVTFKKEMLPADDVVVAFIPTSKVVDEFTKEIKEGGRFYLHISLLSNDDWFALSYKSYEKDDIVRLGTQFIGLNKRQAERVWKAKKLGEVRSTKLSW